MSFNVGTENSIIEETNTAQLGLKLEINMFNPLKKIAMEDKKQQSCGEMDIKLKVTRRPRRFKPGSDLTDKVNLVFYGGNSRNN
jgi:hypothetical protein